MEKAKTDYAELSKNLGHSKIKLLEMDKQLDAMSTFEQSLMDIRDSIKHGNPWKPFSKNIKDATKESDKYEYAVFRNEGFRTLTASSWNSGRRVITSPYMTGDSDTFKLGGSLWIWDTKDQRDDNGIYHLYYYYTNEGTIATTSGNAQTNAENGGEGMIYRRPRK